MPPPADEPKTPLAVSVQLKVVPVTALFKLRAVVVPLQRVVGPVNVAAGVGFTATAMMIGVPGQVAAVGVTV